MSNMWKGPSAALQATHTDPLCRRLHRRAGEQNVAYDINNEGNRAEVYRLERQGAAWIRIPLGVVEAGDPIGTFIAAALEYTEHDAELFDLCGALIARRVEQVAHEIEETLKRVTVLADTLNDHLEEVRSRNV